MNRAALYLRSSKDRSDVSIDSRRRALHELAVARGLVVVEEYADAVESGKDEDRPAWLRLVAALKAPGRAWDHVLVLDTSRVARRRLIAMMFEADCQKRGVRIVYRSLPEADPATDMVLRRVADLEHQRAELLAEAEALRARAQMSEAAGQISDDQVRVLLGAVLDEIAEAGPENAERRDEARQAMREVLERVEITAPTQKRESPVLRLHFAVNTGDIVASPMESIRSPVARWASPPVQLRRRA